MSEPLINLENSSALPDIRIVSTQDGSHSLYHAGVAQHYHSTFGAHGESRHIFIECGFRYASQLLVARHGKNQHHLSILEIGFGTGLNAWLTLAASDFAPVTIGYDALEPYPVDATILNSLNYPSLPGFQHAASLFAAIHSAVWEIPVAITNEFTLCKRKVRLETFIPEPGKYDLVYFDAFDPVAQPELWTDEIFRKMAFAMAPGSTLVTYCVKGSVVRALQAAGFTTEKLPGPPGKRHILRATRVGS